MKLPAILLSAVFAILQLIRTTGIDFTHRNSPTSQKYLVETMTGGVAVLDYNNDGLLDILFVNGGKLRDPQQTPPDFARRGFADVFVSNDGMEQYLFHNHGDGTFEERAVEAGAAYGDDGKTFAGMGVAFADYDNDVLPDIVVTNLALEKYALYHNDGGGHFSYASLTTGLAGLSARSSGWGLGLQDFDNDGWTDLFVAQGHVLDNVERINASLRYRECPALFRNTGGRFEKDDLGDLPSVAGRGAAFGDLNNDGMIDVVVSVLGGRPLILYGRPNRNHWLTLKLEGRKSNRNGLGAKVRVGRQASYVTTSGSYLSASDGRVHFGLGPNAVAAVEVQWPDGKKQVLDRVPADRVVVVKEPE
jgi:hypothetical protein